MKHAISIISVGQTYFMKPSLSPYDSDNSSQHIHAKWLGNVRRENFCDRRQRRDATSTRMCTQHVVAQFTRNCKYTPLFGELGQHGSIVGRLVRPVKKCQQRRRGTLRATCPLCTRHITSYTQRVHTLRFLGFFLISGIRLESQYQQTLVKCNWVVFNVRPTGVRNDASARNSQNSSSLHVPWLSDVSE